MHSVSRSLASRTLAVFVIMVLVGCASKEFSARYQQSLLAWEGASTDKLVATWGRLNDIRQVMSL
jgi:uncharacterized lipoprotein YehR (DUF1307 family)